MVLKAIQRTDGIVQRYNILAKNLIKYEKTGEVWHRFRVLKKIDIETIAGVTVRFDYISNRGNCYNLTFEVDFFEKMPLTKVKERQKEMENQIRNGIASYFSVMLLNELKEDEIEFKEAITGKATGEHYVEELTATVRGNPAPLFEEFIRKAGVNRLFRKEVD